MAPMAWILAVVAVAGFARSQPVHSSSLGTLNGTLETFEGVDILSFLGIPYAKPPLGDLRFASPQAFGPVGKWKAEEFRPMCPQPKLPGRSPANESEDCLYLNIRFKTTISPDDNKAVLVVIHGGAFSMGAASNDMYNTMAMAALGDFIVVSFNYRLGMLGFADMKDLAPGNLGLSDQVLALEWVRDNIAQFGGDPKKVTLMGVSAGSMSVGALLASPLVRGKNLFKQVVMDAGVLSRTSITTQDYALNRVKEIAGKLGCATEGEKMLGCLRAANATQLTELSYDPKLSPIFTFVPTVDGKFLTTDPTKDTLENADKFDDVRMIIGVSKNEGTMFAAMYPTAQTLTTEAEFESLMEKISRGFLYSLAMEKKEVKEAIVQTYYGKSADHFNDVAEFIADGSFVCPTDVFVKNYAKTHKNVYVYRFERMFKSQFLRYGQFEPSLLGVYHASSFLHFLGAPLAISDEARKGPLEPEDKEFIKKSMRMLADFVTSDAAPKLGDVTWPNFSSGEGVLVINDNTTVGQSISQPERCQKVFSFLESA